MSKTLSVTVAVLISLVLTTTGCGKKTEIAYPARVHDDIKIPLLVKREEYKNGGYTQRNLIWRGTWDLKKGSLTLEERPLIEPEGALSGANTAFGYTWSGSDEFIVTHNLSDRGRPVIPFRSGSEYFKIDTYTVNTHPDHEYSVTFRDSRSGTTYSAYTGEHGFEVVCRSGAGAHWHLLTAGSSVEEDGRTPAVPLMITCLERDIPGILLVSGGSGGEILTWKVAKDDTPSLYRVDTGEPNSSPFLSAPGSDACVLGDRLYLSMGNGVFSFPTGGHRPGSGYIKAVPEERINRIIKGSLAGNPPGVPAYIRLGAFGDMLLVAIPAGERGTGILAFKNNLLLSELVISPATVEHYTGVILPQENSDSLFSGC
ncbi:MAG: hypothetical protein K6T66_06040 [Peptococcaceae bacterium]|nr:hypothetical protein [Peptococcaceae bacterium]